MVDLGIVHTSPFHEFTALLVLAAAIGFTGQRLRQPLIVGFSMELGGLLAVDFNPEEVARWGQRGVDVVYGDVCDQDFLESLPLHDARWIVCAMPHATSRTLGGSHDAIKR